jgi:hypothetical protein
MFIARKLAINLGLRALLVLGPFVYLRYLFTFFCKLPLILRAGDFKPLDQAMGTRPITARMNGRKFIVDCPHTDKRIVDGTFVFGIIREMYIRNCYLRYGTAQAARTARTVLDLGANRGAFSVMMASQAELVIAVEFNPLFKDVIAHNMAVNNFTNYEIETAFIGEGGAGDNGKQCRMSLSELMEKHNLQNVDLMKMDIEGSEFALFQSPEWLTHVSALCMEVHTKYGNPQEILAVLQRYAFDFVMADVLFRPVEDPKRANFIYAWKSRNVTNLHSKK